MSLDFPIRACWMKRGQQTHLPAANGPQAFQHVIGALNWRTEHVSYTTCLKKNSQTFIEFLEHLMLVSYPTQSIVLVMDNAPYHHSAQTRAALSLFEHRLLVFWLPAYCSTLNPIERFWRHLKDLALANKLFLSTHALLQAINHIIVAQNQLDSPLHIAFSKDFQ
jgi:transposase